MAKKQQQQVEESQLPTIDTVELVSQQEFERMQAASAELVEKYKDFKIETAADYEVVKADHAKCVRMRTQTDDWRKGWKRKVDEVSAAIIETFSPAESLLRGLKEGFEAKEKQRIENEKRIAAERLATRENALFEAGATWNGGLYMVGSEFCNRDFVQDASDSDFEVKVLAMKSEKAKADKAKEAEAEAAEKQRQENEALRLQAEKATLNERAMELKLLGAQIAKQEDGTVRITLGGMVAGRGDLLAESWPGLLDAFTKEAERLKAAPVEVPQQVAEPQPVQEVAAPEAEPAPPAPPAPQIKWHHTLPSPHNLKEQSIYLSGAFDALKAAKINPDLKAVFVAMLADHWPA